MFRFLYLEKSKGKSFSQKPSLHRGGAVGHNSAFCWPLGGMKRGCLQPVEFATSFSKSIETFFKDPVTYPLKPFHPFSNY